MEDKELILSYISLGVFALLEVATIWLTVHVCRSQNKDRFKPELILILFLIHTLHLLLIASDSTSAYFKDYELLSGILNAGSVFAGDTCLLLVVFALIAPGIKERKIPLLLRDGVIVGLIVNAIAFGLSYWLNLEYDNTNIYYYYVVFSETLIMVLLVVGASSFISIRKDDLTKLRKFGVVQPFLSQMTRVAFHIVQGVIPIFDDVILEMVYWGIAIYLFVAFACFLISSARDKHDVDNILGNYEESKKPLYYIPEN